MSLLVTKCSITHHQKPPTLESDQGFCPAHGSNIGWSIELRACCVKWSTSNLEMVNVHLNRAIEENCSPTTSSFQSSSSEPERDPTQDKVSRHLNCNYRRANLTQVRVSDIHFKKKNCSPSEKFETLRKRSSVVTRVTVSEFSDQGTKGVSEGLSRREREESV